MDSRRAGNVVLVAPERGVLLLLVAGATVPLGAVGAVASVPRARGEQTNGAGVVVAPLSL